MTFFPIVTHQSADVSETQLKDTIDTLYVHPRTNNMECSSDPDSLRYQAYLFFCRYPHCIQHHHQDQFSPSGHLPTLHTTQGSFLADSDIVKHINKTMLVSQSKKEFYRDQAFTALIDAKIRTALEYELWGQDKPFNDISCKIKGSDVYPWPISYFVPRMERSTRLAGLALKPSIASAGKMDADLIYSQAEKALDDFDGMLSDSLYLCGDARPWFCDATLFAYLHIVFNLLSVSVGSRLHAIVVRKKHLIAYVDRIWNDFFKHT